MSYNNPNYNEILTVITTEYPEMKKHFCKSYLNLALGKFFKEYKRKANLDDAQVLFDLYQEEWLDYYIFKPQRDREIYNKLRPLYKELIHTKRNIYEAACRFIEYKLGEFIETPDRTDYWLNKFNNKLGYYKDSCGDILEKLNYKESPVLFVNDNYRQEFINWVISNKKNIKQHYKNNYIDYSHLAYNGVTDDF